MSKRLKTIFLFIVCIALALPTSAKDYLYCAGANTLDIIDCAQDVIVKSIPYDGIAIGTTPSPDGKRFYMSCYRKIIVVDTDKKEIIDTYNFWSDLNRITVNPAIGVSEDGSKLYLSCHIVKKKLNIPKLNVLPPQLVIFDTKTKKMIKNYEIPPMCTGVITLRNDPNTLYLYGQDISTIDLKTGKIKIVKGVLHPEPGNPQLSSPMSWTNRSNGDHGLFTNLAYTAGTFDKLFYTVIDTNTGEFRMIEGKEVFMGYSTIVSPDKKCLYAVMDEVYKVDFKTGETLGMDVLKLGTNYCLALTSDGEKLYVGGGSTLSIYDTATMKLKAHLPVKGDVLAMNRISK